MRVPLLHPTELPPRSTWVQRALCAEIDPDLWYPANGPAPAAAVATCRRCPVAAECLTDALANERSGHQVPHGVWGGQSARQRRQLIARHPLLCADCPSERASRHSMYCPECAQRRRAENEARYDRQREAS